MEDRDMVRVCYILPRYEPASGSHFFYLYELLERAGRELDVQVIVERMESAVRAPFPVYRQRFHFAPLRAFELFFLLLRERGRGTKYFYTHYSFFGAFASWLVTSLLGGTAYYWNCGMPWLYSRSGLEESVFRFILRHTVLVTGTKGIADEYQRRYQLVSDRIRVLPNWINCARWLVPLENDTLRWVRNTTRRLSEIDKDKRVVLFVHRLSKRKGSNRILPIASSVLARHPDVIFLVLGTGPDREMLESEIKNLKLQSNVIMVGVEPNAEVPHYFAAADVFFMPSEEEGFPHVLLEAMASGVPYVASDVGGVREITPMELQEYVIPGENTELFAQKIIRLLSMDSEERRKMVQAEQEWVKQYDIRAVLPEFVVLFHDRRGREYMF